MLQRGSRDQIGTNGPVTKLQLQLRALGLPAGDIDGIFGRKTEEAVRQFQARRGIKVDGIVGPETTRELTAVEEALAANQAVQGFVIDPAFTKQFLALRAQMVPSTTGGAMATAQDTASKAVTKAKELAQDKRVWLVAGVGAALLIGLLAFRRTTSAFAAFEDATGLDIQE